MFLIWWNAAIKSKSLLSINFKNRKEVYHPFPLRGGWSDGAMTGEHAAASGWPGGANPGS